MNRPAEDENGNISGFDTESLRPLTPAPVGRTGEGQSRGHSQKVQPPSQRGLAKARPHCVPASVNAEAGGKGAQPPKGG